MVASSPKERVGEGVLLGLKVLLGLGLGEGASAGEGIGIIGRGGVLVSAGNGEKVGFTRVGLEVPVESALVIVDACVATCLLHAASSTITLPMIQKRRGV